MRDPLAVSLVQRVGDLNGRAKGLNERHAPLPRVIVLQNWFQELKRLVPVD